MKVSWTPRAKLTYYKILDYLLKYWGIKEVEVFINRTNEVIKSIESNPQMFI